MRERIGNLSRRELLKLFGITVGASVVGEAGFARKVQAQSKKVTPRKSVRNVVFVQNCGAMSPPECLDLKETKFTAKDLDIQNVNSDFRISKTIFPNYERWAPKAALVRSMYENSLVHFSAQYHTQAGRALNAAILREIPSFGSIIAMELDKERRDSDTFPTFMSFDLWQARCPQIGSGMLHPRFAGLDLNTSSVFESFGVGNEDNSAKNNAVLAERWEVLGRMSEVAPSGGIGGKANEYKAHYEYAFKILMDPRFKKLLALSDEDKSRYGADKDKGTCKLGLAFLLARNTLAADAGARFLYVANTYNGGNGPADNHDRLYGRGALAPKGAQLSIYESGPRLDAAFGSFIEDLSKMPGKEPGKTLLDETLVVFAHEFGRNPEMNSNGGRDHWGPCYADMFIGGGIKPGVIGKTDGYKTLENGWKYKEQPMKDHLVATMYSALGIDYGKKIADTPSGRAYEYQQTAPLGGPAFIPLTEINELYG